MSSAFSELASWWVASPISWDAFFSSDCEVVPLLTLLADAVGILGGLLVAVLSLDITPVAYWGETLKVVKPWDVFSGMLKSGVFAGAIALIACQQGLATSGGAEGVGRRTTSAVVSILFALILLDAVFTVVLGALGL